MRVLSFLALMAANSGGRAAAQESVATAWPELRSDAHVAAAVAEPRDLLAAPEWPRLEAPRWQESRDSTRAASFNVGVGFTVDPGMLLLSGEVDVPVAEHSFVGPLLQLGVSDDRFMLAPAAVFRHELPLQDPALDRLTPWIEAGAGFVYAHLDRRRGSDDDLGLLLLLGGGVEFKLSERLAARFGVLIDILPIDVFGDHLFLSVQLISLTFRF